MIHKLNKFEIIAYCILVVILTLGLSISYTNDVYFDTQFAVEDGIIEWLTALMLLASSIILFIKTKALWAVKSVSWRFGIITLVLLFLFAAGEEISWGQRIFNIESNAFFTKNNLQQETNLHNITLGNVNLNKLIFGKIISVILLFYIMFLPILYFFYNWIQKVVDGFAIPILHTHHILAFIISTVIIIIIPSGRKWELYEFCFAFIFLMIFNHPYNNCIYKNKSSIIS